MHLLTNRCENRLIFEYQRELAQQFGFHAENRQNNEDVEQFMHFYFKTVRSLVRLNEMLLQLFNERFLSGQADTTPQPLNDNFLIINGYLEAAYDRYSLKIHRHCWKFFSLATKPALKGIRATTIRLIRKNLHLIDDGFRENKTPNQFFIEIFRQPHGITHAITTHEPLWYFGRPICPSLPYRGTHAI